ncbi:EamA family transporter, partial [Anaerostipes caccae]
MSKTVRGTIYTLVAGTAWGLSGTSGQYLMVHGFSALSLTNFRLLVAGLALMGMAYFADPKSFGQIWKDK